MKKLLTVDGLSIIRRVYEVAEEPKDFEKILSASCWSIERAKKDANPHHSILAIDYGGETWRHRIYPQYKANRAPTPQMVRDLIPDIKSYVEKVGFDVIMEPDVEADDVLGSAATQWVALSEDHEAVVVTTDKDMCVLMANPRISIRHHFEKIFRTEEWCLKNYQVTSDKISQALALMGDTSDNIPGVMKIGPVGAGYILNKYGTIEAAIQYGNESEHKAMKLLLGSAESARLSARLTALKLDIPINLPYFNVHPSKLQESLF